MKLTLLTPQQIFEQRPSFQNFFSEKQLGYLLWLGIVRGKKLRRSCEICLEDVERLIEFKKSLR